MSLKGWDGTRILGVFDSMKSAETARDDFLKNQKRTETQKELYFPEEFFFDVVSINMISEGCSMLSSSSAENNHTVVRNHIYQP